MVKGIKKFMAMAMAVAVVAPQIQLNVSYAQVKEALSSAVDDMYYADEEYFEDDEYFDEVETPQGGKLEECKVYEEICDDAEIDDHCFEYTGKAIVPEYAIICDDIELTEDIDYEVEYKNNVNAGKATVNITGINDYEGKYSFNFTIKPKKIVAKNVTVKTAKYVYNGKKITPNVIVTIGNNKLKANKDYKVEYSKNVNAGVGNIVVKGIGNYSGTVTKTFNIAKASEKINIKKDVISKKVGDKKFSLEVVANKNLKLKYVSSNTKVAVVDAKGIVTVKGAGVANITIMATNNNYNVPKKSIKIKVAANTPKLIVKSIATKATAVNKIKVSWSKDNNATGYKIMYSSNSSFKGAKTITVAKNVVSKEIAGLKAGTKYFVKVCSVNAKASSAWTKTMTATTPKKNAKKN